jgi:Tol biopolymer transport system component
MKITRFFLFCFISLVLVFTHAGQVLAKAPTTAKIAFTSNRDGDTEIYIMNPDGSQQVNLTEHPAADFDPAWSPTGEQILFNSNRDGQWDLYLIDADGKNVRKVFAKSADRRHPTWLPDGKQIAYLRRDEWSIYIATIDGKTVERIADTGDGGGKPSWSPDGSEIVFMLAGAGEKWGRRLPLSRQIRVVNLHSGAARTLFAERLPTMENPVWSPDGEHLAFSWMNRDLWDAQVHKKWGKQVFDAQTIYVAARDGGEFQQIVSEKGPYALEPAWSPLGDELLYKQQVGNQLNQFQIFKVSIAGGKSEQLTDSGRNYGADWFDPRTLTVQPQPHLLTTTWGEIKK